ncbi:MAG: protein kinase [Planctomycetota bacterium]
MIEQELCELLVARGLVRPERLRALLGRRAPGDGRPLEELLVAEGVLAPGQLARLGGHLTTPLEPEPSRAAAPRPSGAPPASTGAVEGRELALRPELSLRAERVLGEGGMGVVYLVQDVELGRRAALKLIRGQPSPQRVKRFQREVAVTARLDHPGIPPVYAAGRTPEGQHYLLLRYVAGASLAARIEAYHALRAADPGAAEPELRALLQALVKASEAVAYAHSRRIVHRDLKPDNVMIGAFGEVQVVDWGLARDLREDAGVDAALRALLGEAEPGEALGPLPHAGLTRDGGLLGTLAYMPPEQCRPGQDVDARADVFALGAILCELLGGAPPYGEGGGPEVLARVLAGEIELPRPREHGVSPELCAIAARALAAEPAARYPGAEAFAADILAFLEGRAVAAYRYGPWERARGLVRRHPSASAALAVALALGSAGLALSARIRGRAADEARAAAIAAARAEAEEAWTAASAAPDLGRALAALERAQRLHGLTPEGAAARCRAALHLGRIAERGEQWDLAREAFALAQVGVDDDAAAAGVEGVARARRARAEQVEDEVRRVLDELEQAPARAPGARLDDAVFALVRHPEASRRQLCARLAALTTELDAAARELYLEVAQPTELERRAGEVPLAGLAEAFDARLRAPLGQALPAAQAALLRAAEERLERRAYLRTPLEARHLSPPWRVLLAQRLDARVRAGRFDLARVAADVLGRLEPHPTATSALCGYLRAEADPLRAAPAGLALCRLGGPGLPAAAAACRRFGPESAFTVQVARALARTRGALPPAEDPESRAARAEALRLRGDLDAALDECAAALAAAPRSEAARLTRARVLVARGAWPAARDELDALLAGPDGEAGARAEALALRARARLELRDAAGAEADCARALEGAPRCAAAWVVRSEANLRAGRMREALAAAERATGAAPDDLSAWRARSRARREAGDLLGALEDVSRALELDPGAAELWAARASVRRAQGELSRAVSDLSRALELDPAQARLWLERADARQELRDLAGALADAARAAELAPELPRVWNLQGRLRDAAGDLAGALEAFDRALREDPDYAPARVNRGSLHLSRRDLPRALADFERALARSPRDAEAWLGRGMVREARGELEAACHDYAEAARLAPRDFKAWANHGHALQLLGRNEEAERDLTRAIELRPDLAALHYSRGAVRQALRRREQAIADYTRALELDPSLGLALVNRAMLRMELKQHAEAEADCTRAIALNPGDAAAFGTRANARSLRDDVTGAVADLERFLELAPPDHPSRAGAAALLKRLRARLPR